MNDLDKAAEWAEAKQWLLYTMRDLEEAIENSGSDDPYDVRDRDAYFRSAMRNLDKACSLMGVEIIIPALEERL